MAGRSLFLESSTDGCLCRQPYAMVGDFPETQMRALVDWFGSLFMLCQSTRSEQEREICVGEDGRIQRAAAACVG